ncbi:unnamed protein product [Orchesella dallaii]|uniref:Uncharacterized protein n=1 Tax=Orchesella dallaii TaxID=48710 RepID=A0ABP1QI13_9HEXA
MWLVFLMAIKAILVLVCLPIPFHFGNIKLNLDLTFTQRKRERVGSLHLHYYDSSTSCLCAPFMHLLLGEEEIDERKLIQMCSKMTHRPSQARSESVQPSHHNLTRILKKMSGKGGNWKKLNGVYGFTFTHNYTEEL